ncbi:MAG: PA2779 family protein [Pseudobdellovibrionaceae bacterium]
MLFSKSFKVAGSVFMSTILTNAPTVVMAEAQMIPTHIVAAEFDRSESIKNVHDFLNRDDVQKLLMERGLSKEEAYSRVASLSESELKQLNGQIAQAKAGGDILVAVLIIVLIIFLIKRI